MNAAIAGEGLVARPDNVSRFMTEPRPVSRGEAAVANCTLAPVDEGNTCQAVAEAGAEQDTCTEAAADHVGHNLEPPSIVIAGQHRGDQQGDGSTAHSKRHQSGQTQDGPAEHVPAQQKVLGVLQDLALQVENLRLSIEARRLAAPPPAALLVRRTQLYQKPLLLP